MPKEPHVNRESVTNIRTKIKDRTARVGVIGMGYVGLPTMIAIAEVGFEVTGIDIRDDRVTKINRGDSYIADVEPDSLARLINNGKISATTKYDVISELDIVLVCVPTPITTEKEPDLRHLRDSIASISSHLGSNQLIVLQSTTFPGTTQEIVQPNLESSGKSAGKDFFLAFASERIDPGNKLFAIKNVPKVLGGITETCTSIATDFFASFVDIVVPVSSPRAAEMTKLLENTFRSVNIALVNEMAMLCTTLNIDIWEVIRAASTKPFGFMPFFPGPGVGGHCIPVDPFYLAWKAEEQGFHVNFIRLAAEINDHMPDYTSSRIVEILQTRGIQIDEISVLALGVTFKANIDDIRNSPAMRVIELLMQTGARVSYSDDNVPSLSINGQTMYSRALDSHALGQFDATIILVGHDYYDLEQIIEDSNLVIDTRNVTGSRPSSKKLIQI